MSMFKELSPREEFIESVLSGIESVATTTGMTGASLHCATMGYDEGIRYVVTGPGISRAYGSAAAAYASYKASWKSRSIWRVYPSNKRTLVFR